MKPAILFVDDEPLVLDGLRDLLHARRRELRMAFAGSGAEALERLAAERFDVVVSDMRMPGLDGADLLARVRDEHAHAVRVILSGQASEEAILRMVPVAHLAMAKPCSGFQLRTLVERACTIGQLLEDPALRASIHGIGALPSPPLVARQLLDALTDASTCAMSVAAIVEGDVALAAKVLQLVNSGFFGLPQEVSDLPRAIALLGADLLGTLAVARGALQAFRPDVASPGFSIDAFEAHAQHVGRLAARLCTDAEQSRTAGAAGLLHDVGRLVLASRAPAAAHEEPASADDDPHAAVGGYLLALWGLPETVVRAVAGHHEPVSAAAALGHLDAADAVRIAVLAAAATTSGDDSELAALASPEIVARWLTTTHEAQEAA